MLTKQEIEAIAKAVAQELTPKALFSVTEAAHHLGIGASTLRMLTADGIIKTTEIEGVKRVLYSRAELDRYIATSQKVAA